MANNYEAIVRAVLDQRRFDSEIDKLQNARYELKNVGVANVDNIASEIQKALNSRKFNIDINPVIGSGGSGAGKNIANAVETAINTGIGRNSVSVNLKDALQFKGVDSKVAGDIVKSISKDVDAATLKLKSFDAKFKETAKNGRQLQSIKFTGIDEDGKTLTILSQIDKKTGEVSATITNVSEKFNIEAQSANRASESFNKLLGIQKEISSIEIKLERSKFDSNSKSASELRDRLANLRQEYTSLYTQLASGLSTDQISQLNVSWEQSANKIRELKLLTQDGIELKISTQKLDADIQSVKTKFATLKANGASIDVNLENQINTLQDLRNQMNGQSGDALKSTFQQYSTLLDIIESKLSIIKNEDKGVVSSLDVDKLRNKMTTWLDKNSRAAKDYGGAINLLVERLKNLDTSSEDAAAELNKINDEFEHFKQSAIAAGKTGKSFGDSLKDIASNVFGVVSVATVFYKAVEVFKDMYQEVYAVDTAMINLKKVTDETDSRYNKFLKNSASSAKELGRSISSLVEQTANWAKLGYSLDESEDLAKLSSIYANVAEVDDETAVSDMVTALRGFSLETTEAQHVVDSLNALSNSFAVTAADLGSGLSKSASAMHSAGTDMNKALAMITGGSEITQSATEFGNFMRVGVMRIRGMKGELEELGEEVDESVDSISKVQTQILNLTKGKVNIFDDKGEFRDYYDIMEDIAGIVDDMTSTDKASLYEILFGKMRGNQGAALIEAFKSGQIQKAYETAINSDGSAIEEQTRWLESLEAKTQQFNAAWQELSLTVLDSDFLKEAVDVGTAFLEVLTRIVDTIGPLGTITTGVGIFEFVKNLD